MDAAALGGFPTIIIMVALFAAVYFFMMRPQKKREKEEQERRNSVEVGDEVTTIGGIVGRVVSLKEDTFVLETAGERSRIRFARWAIRDVGKLVLDDDGSGSDLSTNMDTSKKDKKKKADK